MIPFLFYRISMELLQLVSEISIEPKWKLKRIVYIKKDIKQNKPSAHGSSNGNIHLLIKERMIFGYFWNINERLKSILQQLNCVT